MVHSPQSTPLHGLSVLIVDDNPVVRLASRACVQPLGLDVVCAEDGDAALREMSRRRFDAVLMDLHMPGRDGFETTRMIRALGPGRGDVPVIALSATAEPHDLIRCRHAALNACLEKPLDTPLLGRVLERLCTAGGAGVEGAWTWIDTAATCGPGSGGPATADARRASGSARSTSLPPAAGIARERSTLQRLEDALAEQIARHGPAHPLTRALRRAAQRLSADLEPALSPSGR